MQLHKILNLLNFTKGEKLNLEENQLNIHSC